MQNPMQMMSQLPGEKDNKSGSKRGYLLHEKSWGGDRVLKRMREKLQQNSGYNGSKKGKLKSFSSSGRNAHLEAEKGRTLDDGEVEEPSALEKVMRSEKGAGEEAPED